MGLARRGQRRRRRQGAPARAGLRQAGQLEVLRCWGCHASMADDAACSQRRLCTANGPATRFAQSARSFASLYPQLPACVWAPNAQAARPTSPPASGGCHKRESDAGGVVKHEPMRRVQAAQCRPCLRLVCDVPLVWGVHTSVIAFVRDVNGACVVVKARGACLQRISTPHAPLAGFMLCASQVQSTAIAVLSCLLVCEVPLRL